MDANTTCFPTLRRRRSESDLRTRASAPPIHNLLQGYNTADTSDKKDEDDSVDYDHDPSPLIANNYSAPRHPVAPLKPQYDRGTRFSSGSLGYPPMSRHIVPTFLPAAMYQNHSPAAQFANYQLSGAGYTPHSGGGATGFNDLIYPNMSPGSSPIYARFPSWGSPVYPPSAGHSQSYDNMTALDPNTQEIQYTSWMVNGQSIDEGHLHQDHGIRLQNPVVKPKMSPKRSTPDFKSHSPPYRITPKTSRSDMGIRQSESLAASRKSSVSQIAGAKPAAAPSPKVDGEFVMWVRNLPEDVSHDELSEHFQPKSGAIEFGNSNHNNNGIVTIFLLNKTNSALVEYRNQDQQVRAIREFNATILRPHDASCLPMICIPRNYPKELTEGVNAQRSGGMHKYWVQEQRHKKAGARSSPLDSNKDFPPLEVPDTIPNSKLDKLAWSDMKADADDSASETSTTSSFFTRHFPTRFFILKALTQRDLETSFSEGIWRTQYHNEAVLDRAFRTSENVFLFFSVNRSGGFSGYARMKSGINVGQADGEHAKLGSPFQIEWISKGKLSFTRTTHLQNPWNGCRDIKISRDGIELESNLGNSLITEYLGANVE